MINNTVEKDIKEETLWKKAEASGIPRRRFLLMLATGGAATVLTACTSRVTTTSPGPPASPGPTTPPGPSPSPTPAERLVDKPLPARFFNSIGSANNEMKFEVMADQFYVTP